MPPTSTARSPSTLRPADWNFGVRSTESTFAAREAAGVSGNSSIYRVAREDADDGWLVGGDPARMVEVDPPDEHDQQPDNEDDSNKRGDPASHDGERSNGCAATIRGRCAPS